MTKIVEQFELYGKTYSLETGEVARQATGAVIVRCEDTTVLVTTVVSKDQKDFDFFPLTVEYVERMYAVGRIPGGYLKREGRASEQGILTARMIDRPLRACFADGFRNEVQVVAMPLVHDQMHAPDVISVMGASAALGVGGVPFEGPIACVRIGRNQETGEFIVNPSYEERDTSDLDLEIAGSRDSIAMVEASAHEVSEEVMLEAFAFAQKVIGEFCDAQERFFAKCAIEPKEYPVVEELAWIHDRVFASYDAMAQALSHEVIDERKTLIHELKEEIKASFTEDEQHEHLAEINAQLKSLEKKAMRTMVLETGERIDGRRTTEIRPITVSPDYLPLVHGSGLFTRGNTQVLSVLALGMLSEWQRLDTLEPLDGKRYMHHYNFPPYCTGETGRMGAPKRREIGHGNLAERALRPVLPSVDDFPYAIRVVSEVTESNGSSSMASTCGSTLALMDGGVPITRPVSGIAMGLIQEGDQHVVLSDIQGIEDFLGDMDFKVCGTSLGITALQMDNKAKGLSVEILSQALNQAKEGRAFILGKMLEQISEPRPKIKDNAPHIETIKIPVDKIRDVIGSGGKVIRGIQDDTGATIEIEEDGTVRIASTDDGGIEARRRIEAIVKVPEVGEVYDGQVVGIQAFGAFVQLMPGKDGLLHISRVAQGRVDKVEDVLEIGQTVKVEIIEIDEKGKISLDRLDKPEAPAGAGRSGGHHDRRAHQTQSRHGSGDAERRAPRRRHS